MTEHPTDTPVSIECVGVEGHGGSESGRGFSSGTYIISRHMWGVTPSALCMSSEKVYVDSHM